MSGHFAKYAKKLQEKGYDPVPIKPGDKKITLKDWQSRNDLIDRKGQGWKGVSHRTAVAPAIDVDVRDSGVTQQLVEWMYNKGFRGFRYGERPKFACIGQWESTPQRKIISTEYDLGRIEILGVGQQLVMFNQHPNGYEYEWENGSPLDLDVGDLPVLTESLRQELFAEFERLMDQAGHNRINDEKVVTTADTTDVPSLTDAEITEYLTTQDPDCSYDEWVRIGMGIYHAGGRLDQWDQWSVNSPKYPGYDELEQKWGTFGQYTGPKAALKGYEVDLDEAADLLTVQLNIVQEQRIEQQTHTAFESAFDAYHSAPKYDWLIKGIVERDTISMLYGSYGTFKSFVMVDMGMHVAAGRPYLGRNTQQGAVFFLIGEGKNGIKRRIKAWFKYMDIKPDQDFPFYYSTVPANLNDPQKMEELLQVMDRIASIQPAMIVIDTLHKSMPGLNENSAEDMGIAIAEVEKLKQRHRASCWIVHHSGKDASRGARGSSSIPGAMDNSYELDRPSPDLYGVVMNCDKIKDGRKPMPIQLEAVEIQLGEDEDGDPVTSLVMTSEVFTPAQRYARQLGLEGVAATAYEVIFEADGQELEYEAWREKVMASMADKKPDTARKAFQRAKDLLFEKDIIMGEMSVTLVQKIELFPRGDVTVTPDVTESDTP